MSKSSVLLNFFDFALLGGLLGVESGSGVGKEGQVRVRERGGQGGWGARLAEGCVSGEASLLATGDTGPDAVLDAVPTW